MKNMITKDFNKRLYFAALRTSKDLVQNFYKKVKNPHIAFIAGCQRSGTTLMYEIFQKDFNAKVYPEFSKLSDSADPEKLRLLPLEKIKNIFENGHAEMIISKPLVESQNLDKLLKYFKGSKAIWMFRDYKSVAKSNIKHFGIENGIKDLTPIIQRDKNNWRSERVSDQVYNIIEKFFSNNMNPYDAAALFWFARNSLFFELGLNNNADVMLLSYEELVDKPEMMIRKIYDFIGQKFPGERMIRDIHSEAIGRGKLINLNADIDLLCNALYSKLKSEQLKQADITDIYIKNKELQSSGYLPPDHP